MIRYRPFRNPDPHAIAELWNNHPPLRAFAQPVSAQLLEMRAFCKPYFDRRGLIVAEEENRLVGFVHAGFGCDQQEATLNQAAGTTCMLIAAPHAQRETIAVELLKRSEVYLQEKGATQLLAGNVYPTNPFYLGLYGGSRSPGILESDNELLALFRSSGYQETGQHLVLQRQLENFRPVVNRIQMQIRRQYQVELEHDPPARSWWEACTIGQTQRTQVQLISRKTNAVCGSIVFWNMERVAAGPGVHTMGLIELEIPDDQRRQGLGTFLVCESLRQIREAGTSLAEIQLDQTNQAAAALFSKLGFAEVDRGYVLAKPADSA